jgi:hypothetical protein
VVFPNLAGCLRDEQHHPVREIPRESIEPVRGSCHEGMGDGCYEDFSWTLLCCWQKSGINMQDCSGALTRTGQYIAVFTVALGAGRERKKKKKKKGGGQKAQEYTVA